MTRKRRTSNRARRGEAGKSKVPVLGALLDTLQYQGAALRTRFTWVTRKSGMRLVTIGIALMTLWLLASFFGQITQSGRLDTRRSVLATEVASLEENNRRLHGAADYSESDLNVERIAREQLGYARADDVVLLPQAEQPTSVPPTPTPLPTPKAQRDANVMRWWQALFPGQ